jgi:Flp pilus assembly protein TadD
MFRRSPKLIEQRLLGALLATGCLLAVCGGIQARGQSNCTGAEPLAAVARTHPTAASYTDLENWYGSHSQFIRAAEAFRAALKLDPGSPIVLDGLSRSLIANGDSASAVLLPSKVRLNEALALDLSLALIKQGSYAKLHEQKLFSPPLVDFKTGDMEAESVRRR